MPAKTVLITGCSTGIGRDLARRLALAGYTVIATARDSATLADLPVALTLPLDVTDAASIARAVEDVIRRFRRIDVLVNNAGYALRGAVEEVPDEAVREMFDVNVYGMLRMIRAVAPWMRRQGAGRIINISSIAGRLVVPANGTYSATKFAVEALSDAARWELASFGIQVVVIEPGSIRSHFDATAEARTTAAVANPASPYQALYEHYERFAASMRQQQASPEVVSQVIQRAIEAPRPRPRYLAAIPVSGWLVLHLRDAVWDLVLRRMFAHVPAVPRPPQGAREEQGRSAPTRI